MTGLVGYNFLLDGDALNPRPVQVNGINTTTIMNAIFDHLRLSRDVTSMVSSTIPTEWDFYTILDANFNGNISGGNVDFTLTQLDSIKVKRRRTGTFDWITYSIHPVASVSDLSFVVYDNLAANDIEYEYALVPTLGGIEGDYITQQVLSKFNGVFLCDAASIYKFYAGVQFGTESLSNKTAVYEPLSNQYPIVITNGALKYYQSSLTGTIVSPSEMETRIPDSVANLTYKAQLTDFIVNKKAKIIKDWNGRLWLIMVTDNVTITPNNAISGMFSNIAFNFSQIGDGANGNDLYKAGILNLPQV